MLLFRHKTAKLAFKLKYALAFAVWAGLMYAALVWLRRDRTANNTVIVTLSISDRHLSLAHSTLGVAVADNR